MYLLGLSGYRLGRDVTEWDAAWLSGMKEGTGTGRKDGEKERHGKIRQKVFPSQVIQTVFTGVCRAQQSAVD